MKVNQYKEEDFKELISDYVKRKYGETPYIEPVSDGRKVDTDEPGCAFYTDGIKETSDAYGTTTINGFNVILLLYYGEEHYEMDNNMRLQIYYNKYSSMSFGNFKKLITEYIDTYAETYT